MSQNRNETKRVAEQSLDPAIERKLVLLKHNPTVKDEYEAASESLYPWWWECLRLSDDYAAARRGERGEPYARMAEDFGDLGEIFALWWMERGRALFAADVYPTHVAEITSPDAEIKGDTITAWWDGVRPNVYLRIPLTLERREIMREVGEIVDRELAKQQSEIEAVTQPRRTLYPDQRIRRSSIKIMLQLWKERQTTDEPWWQTGERLGHWPQFAGLPTDDEPTLKQKRRIMTLTLQRFYNNAAKLIQFAAQGDFPRVK